MNRLAWCAVFLLSCAREPTTPSAPAAPNAPSITDPMPKEMRAALRRVEGIRELKATKPIFGKYISRPDLLAMLRKHAADELPPEALVHEELVLKLLGAIPTEYAFVESQFQTLGAEIAGLYVPIDKTMYLLSDLDPQEAEATLLHELVHALQDQHFDLRNRIHYKKGSGDALSAASALGEGDATYVMLSAVGAPPTPTLLRLAITERMKSKSSIPEYIGNSLSSSYIYGYEFAYTLARDGGMGMLNHAWERPPTTSEQILHTAKWRLNEPALPIAAPAMDHKVDDDSLGELGLRLYLELGGSKHDAAIAAAGWGGDRGALSVFGETVQFAWHYRADSDAQGSPALVLGELASVFRRDGTIDNTNGVVCVNRAKGGPLAAVQRGLDVWLVAGPTSSRTWQSQATCADARTALAKLISATAP